MPLQAFEGGFRCTPWENSALFSPPPAHPPTPRLQPPSPAQAQTQFQTHQVATPRSSGSEEPDRSREEERRLRRMISNRESARRSRMRKQRHLKDLRAQVDQLKSQNRELVDQLAAVTGHCLLFCRDNDRLRSEAAALRRRLVLFRCLQRLPPPPPGPPGFPPPSAGTQALAVYGVGFIPETELIA
ncbi:hypothetical protein Taro_021861 [Colocasia esculenta]|uniref:BZIP domain-containing protein n=1 Tax=Colocasia esculenta TaxID=4460 RepID=A0A843V2C7_COLES|nr:hypothetical protein [Colocasia esculenta]